MHAPLTRMTRYVDKPAGLAAIREPECSLAIWQRTPFADFAALTEGDPQDLRFSCSSQSLPALLAQGLVTGGFGGDAACHAALVDDVAMLAQHFCTAMELATCELRLEVVRTDSCRKFHADYVTARLITTYVGEGTDWLDEADAARVAEGGAPQRIHRLAPFDVGLFKGKLASENPAIHRSPPISETEGGARLLLVLNPASRSFVDGADCPLPPQGQLP